MTHQQLTLTLPSPFRVHDVLRFHQRDAQTIAERVQGQKIEKGVLWAGIPACLTLQFTDGAVHVGLHTDSALTGEVAQELASVAARMLGLQQAITSFEQQFSAHPELGPVLQRQQGLRVPATGTPFEALVWAITGQQISVSAAISIRRRLLLACDIRHSGGLYCHPDASHLASMSEDALRAAGFSQSKAATLLRVAAQMESGTLPLNEWADNPPVDTIRQTLQHIKGIGPWTINYTLLRGFGWLDGSLHGDVAVRRSLQQIKGKSTPPSAAETEQWLGQFSPWRALVGAHLWARLADQAY